jgi:KUP system potassium uptake protein
LTSALNKVPQGAWFTVSLACILAIIFSTWRFGKEKQWATERKGRLTKFSRIIKKADDEKLYLTDEYGGGEITKMKGLYYEWFTCHTQLIVQRTWNIFR